MRLPHTPSRSSANQQTAGLLLVKALRLLKSAQHQAVLPLCKQVLTLLPGNFDALYYSGVAHSGLGQDTEAIRYLQLAVAANPNIVEAVANLGKALMNGGRREESLQLFVTLVERQPANIDARLGALMAMRRLQLNERAVQAATEAIAKVGKHWALLNERGLAHLALEQFHDAALDFEAAAHLNIASNEVNLNLAVALIRMNKSEAAVQVLEDLLRRVPGLDSAKRRLIEAYRSAAQGAKGAVIARELSEKYPSDLALRHMLAQCLVDAGKNDEAERIFREIVDRADQKENHRGDVISALSGLAAIHKFTKGEREIDLASGLLDKPEIPDPKRAELLFVLAKMNDDVGNYGDALACASAAKVIAPPAPGFEQQMDFVRAILPKFDSGFFQRYRDLGNTASDPVFIIGMPRSGTTLVEQIIASHTHADGAGELTTFPALAHKIGFDRTSVSAFLSNVDQLTADHIDRLANYYLPELRRNQKRDAARITDKLPHNFLNVWLIALLFPNAHVINCRRHPVDVAISIYLRDFNKFHSYAANLASLGRYLRFYQEVTAHWRQVCGLKWFENDYEALVADPESNIRRMIDFLGLPWDDKCLSHTQTERSVNTFSRWQVRQPIYKTSVERWRKYAPYIKPLLDELGIEA